MFGLTIKKTLSALLLILNGFSAFAQQASYNTEENIHYYADSLNKQDQYINEKCMLDIYYPEHVKNYPTIVWFHGGGLTGGSKEIPEELKKPVIL